MSWLGGAWSEVTSWSPSAWAAIAAWATVVIAAAAAVVALWQVREARRTRYEEAQPYVVAYMESQAASQHFVDLVIRNFGKTAAYDVVVVSDPPIVRTGRGEALDVLPERLPALVPGQEWRTFWESGPDRLEKDLPPSHAVTIEFRDFRGKVLTSESVLAWSTFERRHWIGHTSVHDAAKAIVEIKKIVAKWSNSSSGGLAVYSRDGDQWERGRAETMRRQREALDRLDEAGTQGGLPDPNGGTPVSPV